MQLPSADKVTKGTPVGQDMQRFEGFQAWTPEQLANYFKDCGLGQYAPKVLEHKITGELAPLITDGDIKEMGIRLVGDRLMFKKALRELQKHARMVKRSQAVWEGRENLYYCCVERVCLTGCGCCPDDPATYKLTHSHLKIHYFEPARCGPMKVRCCGGSYANNNIDLSKINDVDTAGATPPVVYGMCCCAVGKDTVHIESNNQSDSCTMTLKAGEGQRIAEVIMNQVEECQVRDGGGRNKLGSNAV